MHVSEGDAALTAATPMGPHQITHGIVGLTFKEEPVRVQRDGHRHSHHLIRSRGGIHG